MLRRLILVLVFGSGLAYGQLLPCTNTSPTTTPNLAFQLPVTNACNWGPPVNANFTALDLLLSGHANLMALAFTNGTISGSISFPGAITLSGITGTIQCLHVSTAGLVSGTGVDCGAGGGGGGTVTSVSGLTPLFTVANGTTTPTFSLSTAAAHTFFGNNTGSTATPAYLQLACADLSNAGAFCSGTAYSSLTGTPQLAITKAAVASNWLRSYDSATGLFTASQPAYTDITGTPVLPANTTATASNFFTAYNSATGAFTKAQPAFTDISGVGSCAQEPAQTGDVVTSGCAATIQANAIIQSKVTNGYVDLSSAQNPIAGTKTFTGVINHTNTLTQTGNITVGNENAVVWVDGPKYSTIELALLDAQCSTQCQINLPSTFAETVTTTITLGNGTTSFVHLHGMPGAHIACNITGGTTPCFIVSNGSGISGELTGTTSGGGALGFNFTYPSTFNGTAIITTNAATTNGNGYIDLEKFFVYGNASATVTTAVVNIENILGQAVLRDFYVANFANTVGVRIATSTGGTGNTGTGPLVVDNVWADGFGNAGAKPCLITTNNSKTMLPIDWVGGVCAHAGNGLNIFEVNGNGNALGTTSGISIRTYLENVTAGNVNTGLRLRDVVGVDFSGTVCVLASASDTCIDISESSANLTAGIHGGPLWKSSPSNTATLLNNHITGETNASAVQSFYNYGGESGTSAQPFIVSNNQVTFKDGANNNLFNISNGLQSAVTIASKADSQGSMGYGCGLTAEQVCFWGLFNRSGSLLWGEGNDGSGNFILSDRTNIKTRMIWTPQATIAVSGIVRLANTETLAAWRNNANSADVTLSKLTNDTVAISSGLSTGASPPNCTPGTAGFMCNGEGTAPTNVASTATIYPSSTTHEYMAATNGASTATPGMMVRSQPSPVNLTAQTALKTTTTLCASSAGACNTAGQYRISYNFWGSGTACSAVTAGSVGLNFTWTDENAVAHTTISVPMWDQKSAANGILFNFNTALGTEGASGSYIISTNGSVIQYATTYTACTTGTGTYNLRIAAERLQ